MTNDIKFTVSYNVENYKNKNFIVKNNIESYKKLNKKNTFIIKSFKDKSIKNTFIIKSFKNLQKSFFYKVGRDFLTPPKRIIFKNFED